MDRSSCYENASKWVWAEIINGVDIKDINKLFDKTISEWDIVDRIRAVREIKWSIAYANAKHIENKNLSNTENWANWNKIFNEKLQAPNNTGVSKKQVLRWNNVSYDEFIGKKPSPKPLVKNLQKTEKSVGDMETKKLITPEVEKYLKTQNSYDKKQSEYGNILKKISEKYPDWKWWISDEWRKLPEYKDAKKNFDYYFKLLQDFNWLESSKKASKEFNKIWIAERQKIRKLFNKTN